MLSSPLNVLLLQGPVGPFFQRLQAKLESQDVNTFRVLFNAGDRLFSQNKNCESFSGNLDEWESWLEHKLIELSTNYIVLFGSMRPIHQVARKLGDKLGITIISLEEGYLRSGYISCELGGNNQHSTLLNWNNTFALNQDAPKPLPITSSFKTMCVLGALYYIWRDLFSSSTEQQLYHRSAKGTAHSTPAWCYNFFARGAAMLTEMKSRQSLYRGRKGEYILVPLQTTEDAQMTSAARGWSNHKLVKQVILALSQTHNSQKIAFKLHPLDIHAQKTKSLIKRISKAQGVSNRVIILRSGPMSKLTATSSGMIVINSTCGFSALHHQKPLLVLGDAIYRDPSIATVGDSEKSIAEFLKIRTAKNFDTVKDFLTSVKTNALLPGDFYSWLGSGTGASAIADRIITGYFSTLENTYRQNPQLQTKRSAGEQSERELTADGSALKDYSQEPQRDAIS